MDESIREMCQRMVLTEDEQVCVEFDEDVQVSSKLKGELCLVGKILTTKHFNSDAAKNTLRLVWKPARGMDAKDLGENLFLFQFHHVIDRRRVMANRPWSFDKHLVMLKEFDGCMSPAEIVLNISPFWVQVYDLPLNDMNEKGGRRIGNVLGKYVETDVGDDGLGWGKFLRIRVEIDVTKPLRRGVMVLDPDGKKIWALVKYERLPTFCYQCGRLGHGEKDCELTLGEDGGSKSLKNQYGQWMRAGMPRKGGRGTDGVDEFKVPSDGEDSDSVAVESSHRRQQTSGELGLIPVDPRMMGPNPMGSRFSGGKGGAECSAIKSPAKVTGVGGVDVRKRANLKILDGNDHGGSSNSRDSRLSKESTFVPYEKKVAGGNSSAKHVGKKLAQNVDPGIGPMAMEEGDGPTNIICTKPNSGQGVKVNDPSRDDMIVEKVVAPQQKNGPSARAMVGLVDIPIQEAMVVDSAVVRVRSSPLKGGSPKLSRSSWKRKARAESHVSEGKQIRLGKQQRLDFSKKVGSAPKKCKVNGEGNGEVESVFSKAGVSQPEYS